MSEDRGQNEGGGHKPTPEDLARQRDDSALRARLGKLSEALEARKAVDAERERAKGNDTIPGGETGKALSLGFRALSEFVAGIIAGGAIGWLVDKGFNTAPVFLLIFGVLGTITGFWNVYRVAMNPTGNARGKDK